MIRFAVGFLAGLALAASAHASCPDGAYAVVGSPLLSSPGGAFTTDIVTIANRTVAIASGCPAVAPRGRGARTRVPARASTGS